MRLELTGRHITITPAARKLVEQRIAPILRKLNDSAVSAHVVLTQQKSRVHAEVTLHARGVHFLHAEALGADIARQGKGVRHGLTAYVRAQLDRYARLFRGGSTASRRKRAIATLAGMIGALTLARAVDDASLSDEILAAARATLGKARSTRRSVGRRS